MASRLTPNPKVNRSSFPLVNGNCPCNPLDATPAVHPVGHRRRTFRNAKKPAGTTPKPFTRTIQKFSLPLAGNPTGHPARRAPRCHVVIGDRTRKHSTTGVKPAILKIPLCCGSGLTASNESENDKQQTKPSHGSSMSSSKRSRLPKTASKVKMIRIPQSERPSSDLGSQSYGRKAIACGT